MKTYEEIMEYLREQGVPKDILDLLDEETVEALLDAFEQETEEETLEWITDYLLFLDAIDNPNNYKRERTAITFASPILKYLKRANSLIKTEDGSNYPLAYFVEDIVSWVLSDVKRFEQFMEETYFREEEEEEEHGEEDREES